MKAEPHVSARYLPFGDSALVVEFGSTISVAVNRKVIALSESIQEAGIQGVEELVGTYRSLLVRYDPLMTNYEQLVSQIREVEKKLKTSIAARKGKRVTFPVVYGGEYGPDLSYVAQHHGLTEEEVVRLHSEVEYRVYMIGFVAGFPYLGEVPDKIATPRHETPRLKVPAGSVGIAEKQTGVYPCEAPGGWQIIGRTPLKLFNPHQQPSTFVEPGDIVKFEPISEMEFKTIEKAQPKPLRKE